MNETLTQIQLEHQIMDLLLAGDHKTLVTLREQYMKAKISTRELTGVGFFTRFVIPPEVRRVIGNPSLKLSGVAGTASNLKNGFGALIFVTEGAINMLEVYTYDEPWPQNLSNVELAGSGETRS